MRIILPKMKRLESRLEHGDHWRTRHLFGYAMLICLILTTSNPSKADVAQPLNSTERHLATATALEYQAARSSLSGRSLQNGTPQTLKPKEVLLTQLREIKAVNGARANRQAEVFVYDYEALQTDYFLVELSSGSVLRTESLDQHHLPLNRNEIALAKRTLANDIQAMSALSAEYQTLFDTPLTTVDDLEIKAVIHRPYNSPDTVTCHSERCAELSLFTTSLVSLSIEPIIRLRDSNILQLRPPEARQ